MEQLVKILIVDDDDVYRDLLKDAIEELGAQLVLAADGIEAVGRLQDCPYDILITDLNMPRMDGLQLVSHARRLYPHILSIIITGYGSLESAIEAIRQGAYDYVQKPFKIEQITIVTRNAIDKVKILREKARLVQELEIAYQKLRALEGEPGAEQRMQNGLPPGASTDSAYCLFSQNSLPLSFLGASREGPDHALTKLERLKELRRDGVINETEFSLLKKSIIQGLG